MTFSNAMQKNPNRWPIVFHLKTLIGTVCVATLCSIPSTVLGQSGGPYVIEKAVIAPGGGAASGGTFDVDGTIAQTIAGGPVYGSPFLVYSGFFSPDLLPTAALISISGRVRTAANRPIGGAVITVYDLNGNRASTRTSTFGHYRFQDLAAGETYVLTVSSRRYVFTNASSVVLAEDNVTDVDFVAESP